MASPECSCSVHDAAFRVLLKHLSPPPAVLLTRASCVCPAWRAASAQQPVLDCGSAPACAVAALLAASAATVEELVLGEWRAAMLPPSVVFPRLVRVHESLWPTRRRGVERLCLVHAAPNLTQWAVADRGFAGEGPENTQNDVHGRLLLALVCSALCDTAVDMYADIAADMQAETLMEYRCDALCQLDAEFTGVLSRLAKQGLLDEVIGQRRKTTLLHAALDVKSLEVVALLLRAGANPAVVVPGVVHSYSERDDATLSPLARAVLQLRIAMDELVNWADDIYIMMGSFSDSVDEAASKVNTRFEMGSLLVANLARARGAEAVAAAAPGYDLALALLPRCVRTFPVPYLYSTHFWRRRACVFNTLLTTSLSLPPRPWHPVCGFLPQLLPLLRAGPGFGGFSRIQFVIALALKKPLVFDPGDAAAAAMGYVRHGSADRAGRALTARFVLGNARFLLTFCFPLYAPACLALKSPADVAPHFWMLFALVWWLVAVGLLAASFPNVTGQPATTAAMAIAVAQDFACHAGALRLAGAVAQLLARAASAAVRSAAALALAPFRAALAGASSLAARAAAAGRASARAAARACRGGVRSGRAKKVV